MSSKNQYSDEFKEQIIKECQETGNVDVVARRYNISTNTIHTWIKKYRPTGSVKTLPKAKILRTDNGPQFMSAKFAKTCQELKLIHERIPVKTPNMNAHIEAFHSILEEECYVVSEFTNYREAYEIVSQYIEYYNHRRIHGSLGYLTPAEYYELHKKKSALTQVA